jgi:UDP-N-acetylmuramoyl-tripeptide--D-alanyl-D-alanine ligase
LTIAAALCIALDEDFTLEEGCQLLAKNFSLPPGRAGLLLGKNGTMIIDSSYNASPQTMMDLLELLAKVPGKRKMALLGDMRELGKEAASAHLKVAQKAQAVCDLIYLVGPLMQAHALPYFEKQAEYRQVRWFATAKAAGQALTKALKQDDVLLVKGSQNTIFLEAAIEEILANSDDRQKLCRRGSFWEKQRLKATV